MSKQKRKRKTSEFSSDGQLEILADGRIVFHGELADEMLTLSKKCGLSVQEVFNLSLEYGLPKLLAAYRQNPETKTTSKNLEAKFDAGEDVLDYFDYSKAAHPGKLKSKPLAMFDEKQIAFCKQPDGNWTVLIHEPLASRVREHCKSRKISTRKFVLGLLQSPNETNIASESRTGNTKPAISVWKPIPETMTDGWLFGSYTRYADPKGCRAGDGFVIAPDGQRAELDWHVGTGKLKRTGRADKRIWGVFEVGFPRPVTSKADLVENYQAVLPQIKAAFARHQKRRQ